MGASQALANLNLDHIFTDPAWTPPATLYMALLDTAPAYTDTGSTISEVVYTNYVRKAVTASDFDAASGGAKVNGTSIQFAQCGTTGDTITHWALCTASSAGSVYVYGMLATDQVSFFGLDSTNTIYAVGHTLVDTDRVVFLGNSLPTGIDQDTSYYVINQSGNSFQISLTSGGAAVNFTSDGFGRLGEEAWRTISNGTIPQFTTGVFQISIA